MKLTKTTIVLGALLALQGASHERIAAQTTVAETYFEYPKVPDNLE